MLEPLAHGTEPVPRLKGASKLREVVPLLRLLDLCEDRHDTCRKGGLVRLAALRVLDVQPVAVMFAAFEVQQVAESDHRVNAEEYDGPVLGILADLEEALFFSRQ